MPGTRRKENRNTVRSLALNLPFFSFQQTQTTHFAAKVEPTPLLHAKKEKKKLNNANAECIMRKCEMPRNRRCFVKSFKASAQT